MGTGYLVASIDWFWYFALTALIAIPGLVFLWLLRTLEAKEPLNTQAI